MNYKDGLTTVQLQNYKITVWLSRICIEFYCLNKFCHTCHFYTLKMWIIIDSGKYEYSKSSPPAHSVHIVYVYVH